MNQIDTSASFCQRSTCQKELTK